MGRLPDPRTVERRPLVHPGHGRNGVWKCLRRRGVASEGLQVTPGQSIGNNVRTARNMLGRQHKVHASTQHNQTA